VAVDARGRHQGGDPIDQLQGGEEQRAAPAWTGLGALVEQAFGIEFAQPVQGEGWPGTVAQQPLAPGAVGGLDAHRTVDGNEVSVEANAGFIGVKRSGRN